MAQEKKLNVACSGHALVFPYPSQGHVNPMLQFAKRIASHNHRVTVAITRFVASTVPVPLATTSSSPISIATISDGFDEGGFSAAPSPSAYVASLESVGGASLIDLLRSLADRGDPVSVVVYDSFLPWAVHVARQSGAAAAAFFSQSAAVNVVYCHAWEGRLRYPLPEEGAAVEGLPGLPRLERDDLPSLVKVQSAAGYAAFSELLLNQFKDLDKADVMLVNTFYELEPQTKLTYTMMPSIPKDKKVNVAGVNHALLVPYPTQGHINPMLQFAKRIASHNHRATAAITRFIASNIPTPLPTASSPVSIATISDGFDQGGFSAAPSMGAYLASLESAGTASLAVLLRSLADRGDPVSVVIYDSFLPWVVPVARQHGAAAASFFTQSAAVNAVYCHAWQGRMKYPLPAVETAVEGLPGLPRLERDELPSFVEVQTTVGYLAYSEMVLNQYKDLDEAVMMLVNTVYELEPREMDWISSVYVARAIGPTVPSAYLDDRIPGDNTYALNLLPLDSSSCKGWISAVPTASGVYASFGSLAELSAEQIIELAHGLLAASRPFLWVVREPDAGKLPPGFSADADRIGGLVVRWAPQMEVLSSGAVGCFVTHCGWNSTTEGLALGVPMVAMPQWTDQPTDAKYLEDVWRVGVRARKGEGGLVGRGEVERCIREVMEGERSSEIRRRAAEWREASRRAVDAGGSSDRNVVEFLERCCRPAGGLAEP